MITSYKLDRGNRGLNGDERIMYNLHVFDVFRSHRPEKCETKSIQLPPRYMRSSHRPHPRDHTHGPITTQKSCAWIFTTLASTNGKAPLTYNKWWRFITSSLRLDTANAMMKSCRLCAPHARCKICEGRVIQCKLAHEWTPVLSYILITIEHLLIRVRYAEFVKKGSSGPFFFFQSPPFLLWTSGFHLVFCRWILPLRLVSDLRRIREAYSRIVTGTIFALMPGLIGEIWLKRRRLVAP